MPELPDIVIYVECLRERILGERLESVTVRTPNLLRTVRPPLASAFGSAVVDLDRRGRRIVIVLEEERLLVLHLMIAGRLRWSSKAAERLGKTVSARLLFSSGELQLTEASTKKRASLHLLEGWAELDRWFPSAPDPIAMSREAFAAAVQRENHTLKRTLIDPRLISGIGNAYSDEILHRARLSPLKQTRSLRSEEIDRLYQSTEETLREWIERLRAKCGSKFPAKVTAFHPEMSVHGRYREPCPVCGSPIQRIAYAENECNYCATCQTGGKLLADRAWSRLLREDWPRTLEELEERRSRDREASSERKP